MHDEITIKVRVTWFIATLVGFMLYYLLYAKGAVCITKELFVIKNLDTVIEYIPNYSEAGYYIKNISFINQPLEHSYIMSVVLCYW